MVSFNGDGASDPWPPWGSHSSRYGSLVHIFGPWVIVRLDYALISISLVTNS